METHPLRILYYCACHWLLQSAVPTLSCLVRTLALSHKFCFYHSKLLSLHSFPLFNADQKSPILICQLIVEKYIIHHDSSCIQPISTTSRFSTNCSGAYHFFFHWLESSERQQSPIDLQPWLYSVKYVTNQAARISVRTYAKAAPTEVSSILEERIRGVSGEANLNETGRVLSIG